MLCQCFPVTSDSLTNIPDLTPATGFRFVAGFPLVPGCLEDDHAEVLARPTEICAGAKLGAWS